MRVSVSVSVNEGGKKKKGGLSSSRDSAFSNSRG